jgi:hypothetical protein
VPEGQEPDLLHTAINSAAAGGIPAATPDAQRANPVAWLPAILAVDEVGRTLTAEEKRVVGDYLARVTAALDRR